MKCHARRQLIAVERGGRSSSFDARADQNSSIDPARRTFFGARAVRAPDGTFCSEPVISARSFVLLWVALAAAVIGYALLDLHLSPSLWSEHHFSMQPDLSQIWEVRHWGGRMVREGAWGLLLPNALVLGGLGALAIHWTAGRLSKRREAAEIPPRNSIAPPSM